MYKVIDDLELQETRIISEKELRDMYKEDIKEIFWNWMDYKDNDRYTILSGFMDELAKVYVCNIDFVIARLKEDEHYTIEKIEMESEE